MAAISESISSVSYDRSFENPTPKEAFVVTDQPQTCPGDSETRMKLEEMLYRALSPNLKNLEREQVIKIQLDAENNKFPLLMELFKIKINALKNAGVSPEEFASQIKSWAETNVLSLFKKDDMNLHYEGMKSSVPVLLLQSLGDQCPPFLKGDQSELKKEVCIICMSARLAADLLSNSSHFKEIDYLKLFELEKEVGFSLFGSELLASELRHLLQLKVPVFLKNITSLQKTFLYLEKEGKVEIIKKVVNQRVSELAPREDSIQILPHLIKYASSESLEAYFNGRFEENSKVSLFSWWKNSYRWIELLCEAAEIIAPLDQQKAQAYLKQAEEKTKTELSVFFFYPNRTAIEQKRQEALSRIAQAKAKIKP